VAKAKGKEQRTKNTEHISPHPSLSEALNNNVMMFAAATRIVAFGRHSFIRSFATVGSQIPNVELHS